MKTLLSLGAVAMICLGTFAQAEGSLNRTEIRRVAAPGSTTHEVIVSRLEVQPGATVPRHTHAGDEHMVVLEGGQMKAGNGKVIPFPVGMTAHFPEGLTHGGLTNVGDAPLVAITTHIVEIGKPLNLPAN